MNRLNDNICVIGLGYVGLTLSISLARSGFNVFGVEINNQILDSLKKNKSTFYEPDINKNIKLVKKKFFFNKSILGSWNCDTYIITVGTPLNSRKKSRTDLVESAVKSIYRHLKEGDLVILRSTVKIGTTENLVKEILDKKKVNYHLAYCPERTAEGKALYEIKNLPQIIGATDKFSSALCINIFNKITNNIVEVSNTRTAEMIKVIDNTQRDTFFAFSNEISAICNKFNISATEVINSCNYKYPRSNLAKPGPVAGPCLSKDAYILSESIKKKIKFSNSLSMSGRKINENVPSEIISFIKKVFNKRKRKLKVVLMGITFKGSPLTSDTRDSFSIDFLKKIKPFFSNSKFYGYDPMLSIDIFKKIQLKKVKNINSVFKNSDIVFILNNNKKFSQLNLNQFSNVMKRSGLIYDCWNLYDISYLNLSNDVQYISFGNHCAYKKNNN
jgi:UDP-N-acetyl-D-mannosaminuronic acid dehydrogenase